MIIPALLTDNPRIAQERITLASSMSPRLHLDLLDDTLFPGKSLTPAELNELIVPQTEIDLHCMVTDPLKYLDSDLPIDSVAIHLELPNWQDIYDELLKRGIDPWLVISPGTDINTLILPEDLANVLLMGVEPGSSGQAMLPDTAERIHAIKDDYANVLVTVDGGVQYNNISEIILAGADNVITASAVFSTTDPVTAYRQLLEASEPGEE